MPTSMHTIAIAVVAAMSLHHGAAAAGLTRVASQADITAVALADGIRPQRPTPNAVWIESHWVYSGKKQQWVKGRWETPPRPGVKWEPAHWVPDSQAGGQDSGIGGESGTGKFFDGYWRPEADKLEVYSPPAPPATPTIVPLSPPPPLLEARSDPPMADAVWIPGYWHYNGERFSWVAGLWSAPRSGHVWMPDQWMRQGDGKWRRVPGRWLPVTN